MSEDLTLTQALEKAVQWSEKAMSICHERRTIDLEMGADIARHVIALRVLLDKTRGDNEDEDLSDMAMRHAASHVIPDNRNVGRPMRPSDIAVQKSKTIPGAVFDAFNEIIAANYTNGRATIRQDGVVSLILQKFSGDDNITSKTIFDRGWLNVEDAYRAEGGPCRMTGPPTMKAIQRRSPSRRSHETYACRFPRRSGTKNVELRQGDTRSAVVFAALNAVENG